MLLELIWALPAAALVGVVPGWFWARLLSAPADLYEHVTYSVALSLALVPAVALIPAQLFGTGVTLAVAVASPLLVFLGGLTAYLRYGPAKASEGPLHPSLVRLGAIALVPITLAFALVLGADLVNWPLFWLARSCWGWPWTVCVLSGGAQKFLLPVALLLLATGLVHRFASAREPDARSSHPEAAPSRTLLYRHFGELVRPSVL